ncbi:hypothetical protein SprV_0602098900 [Sparganum proliferum]
MELSDCTNGGASDAFTSRRSDPMFKTKRTVLHERKQEVIPDINKSISIKDGAERLVSSISQVEKERKREAQHETSADSF